LRRDEWVPLNGEWDFAIEREERARVPAEVHWDSSIVVPFAPETPASGIGDQGFYRFVWYRRLFEVPELRPDERLLLHFGAVDYRATVWVNGRIAVRHQGGYTPFEADITELLHPLGEQTIEVKVEDDPHDLAKPRGKQDWHLRPHSIWYPRTTGIWQTVWLERVPATRIGSLRWDPSLSRWELGLTVEVAGEPSDDLRLRVHLRAGSTILANDSYMVLSGEVHRGITLSDPGIDDYRNELLWSPASPTLIRAEIELIDSDDRVVDAVRSYTALREFSIQGDSFLLNGRPYPLRFVLDQGYWPETGLTPPNDAALRRDVELTKRMGFNGVRRHQKVADPGYLYWADHLGLLVWEEMPSAYRFTTESVTRQTHEWTDVIRRDRSHPCIAAWVPFNESWGVPNLPDIAAQRHYVQGLYHLTKTLDPSRPVIGNDGWESVATDIIGIHDYDTEPERIAQRYGAGEALPSLLKRGRPGGRLIVLEDERYHERPIVLSEFGGAAFSSEGEKTWGYARCHTAEEFADYYSRMMAAVHSVPLLAGFCYTQFADTYQETNGLLYADRTPKIALDEIANATCPQSAGRLVSAPHAPDEPDNEATAAAAVTRSGAGQSPPQ
jgi:beta-galactosidase/beta-glucuronidase